jgi:hypothetical protein
LHTFGQDVAYFKKIDLVISKVDSMASKGLMDTLKSGILNEGGTTSDLFVLKQGRLVQKIFISNKSKNYAEKIVLQDGKPVFAQFLQSDGSKWTYYFMADIAFFKDGGKFNKGSSSYLYKLIDAYIDIFKDQLNK